MKDPALGRALQAAPVRHRPRPIAWVGCGLCLQSRACRRLLRLTFGPSRPLPSRSLVRPLLTPVGSTPSLPAASSGGLQAHLDRHPDRPPRIRTMAFAPAPPHLRNARLGGDGLTMRGRLTSAVTPRMRFVYLGSELRLSGLPSDPTSQWSPCLWLGSAPPPHRRTFTCKPLPMPGVPRETPAEAGALYP